MPCFRGLDSIKPENFVVPSNVLTRKKSSTRGTGNWDTRGRNAPVVVFAAFLTVLRPFSFFNKPMYYVISLFQSSHLIHNSNRKHFLKSKKKFKKKKTIKKESNN